MSDFRDTNESVLLLTRRLPALGRILCGREAKQNEHEASPNGKRAEPVHFPVLGDRRIGRNNPDRHEERDDGDEPD